MNNEKIRYRVTFEKKNLARFVGHLDLQTLFQRALKRAGVPVAYSQGFNPHMLISFAQPLPLGMESLCEMVDIEVTREIEPIEFAAKLNESLPVGFTVLSAELLSPQTKRVAAAVYAATYSATLNLSDVEMQDNPSIAERIIAAIAYVSSGNEPYEAIAEKIISMEFDQQNDTINMTLRAGGEKNLKPVLAVSAVCEKAGVELTAGLVNYTRLEILLKQ